MKKIVLTMTLIAGVVAGAMTLSSFIKSETENDRKAVVATSDDCSFVVTSATPSISGTKVTITVCVEPAFTPSEKGSYKVIVKPEGSLKNILDSQTKSLDFNYQPNYWSQRTKCVEFYCSVDDNTYNQCNSNSFTVSSCFKK